MQVGIFAEFTDRGYFGITIDLIGKSLIELGRRKPNDIDCANYEIGKNFQ